MKTGAVILAAGAPERMEGFRPLLYVGGKTMIRHIVDTLKAAGIDLIAVVTGYREDSVRKHLDGSGVRFVRNRYYADTQMLDSLLLGADSLEKSCDRLLVIPADVPLVSAKTIASLLAWEAPVVRPVCEGQAGHPVILSHDALALLRRYQGEGGLAGMVEALGLETADVPVPDRGVLMDANTSEELERLQLLEKDLNGRGRLREHFDLQLAVDDVVMDGEMARLLALVEDTGSLQTASVCVGSSYSKSWRRIRDLERQLGVEILQSVAGGAKGGGSRLTEAGACLLRTYLNMQEEGKKLMHWLFLEHFSEEVIQKIQKM